MTSSLPEAITGRTTVIYSPHPDDETLRLSGYINFAAHRGDYLILVAVTDGGGTGLVKSWGWTPELMEAHRRIEQEFAWAALTEGSGEIIRLEIEDGKVAESKHTITEIARQLEFVFGPNIEHYVAARDDDVHADHRAVVQAVREAQVRIVRVSRSTEAIGGTKYFPPNIEAAKSARNSYRAVGWPSVPSSFQALSDRGHVSYITP